jgi:serine/threonine protein kinase
MAVVPGSWARAKDVDVLMRELQQPDALQWKPDFDFWDNYELVDVLGEGNFGKVVRVRRKSDGKEFALKLLNKVNDETQNEIASLRLVTDLCPELVRYYGAFQIPEGRYQYNRRYAILMEYIEGRSLLEEGNENPTAEEMRKWSRQLAQQLACLHRAGITHADIKSENILIDNQDNARLIDFGLSCTTQASNPVKACDRKHWVGTPFFVAPEWYRNDPATNFGAADVYSLGVTILESMLGGDELAYLIAPDGDIDWNQVESNSQFIFDWTQSNEFWPADPQLQSLVRRMVDLDPEYRPTAQEIADRLSAARPKRVRAKSLPHDTPFPLFPATRYSLQ